MESESKKKHIDHKIALKWVLIIAVNVIVAIIVTVMSVLYTIKQNEARYDEKEDSFSTALDAMGQTAYLNLHTEQVFVDNWSSYLDSKKDENYKLSDVERFLSNINTDVKRVNVQVVDYKTLKGFYILPPDPKKYDLDPNADTSIDYNNLKDNVSTVFQETITCTKDESHLHITSPFFNPADGKETIGFCHKITAVDDMIDKDGTKKDFVLVRLLQVSEFYGEWLPPSFKKTKLALIDKEGEFIVPFNSSDRKKLPIEESNFFDYLINQTSATENTISEIRDNFDVILSSARPNENNFAGTLTYDNNNFGQEAYYSYHRLRDDEDWVLVGYLLQDEIDIINFDITLVIIVMVGFFILMLVDGTYILITNKRLKKSMEEIQYANEAKTRFLSSMSHDIRTPMNAIIGMTTIATKRIDDTQQVQECLRQITRASNHLLTLINDVLDISKVESGKLTLNPAVFSLAEVMANITSITQPHIKEKQMDFEIHARNVKHEYIFADELRLNQILINLISNAIKYTPEKGRVLFSIEEKPSDKGPNIACLVFVVEDNGIGISDEFKKHMYDTFARDIDSRINTIQGAGLGLAITKQMVDMMEGTIEVQSKVGVGTKFTVTLDLPIAETMTDDLILPPLKLLVVDDDELFLESAEDTLESLGLEADTVSSGSGAVQMVEEHHRKGTDYQCVIVDWKMPDMDGIETIREIRKVVGDDVSVIIISAYDWSEIEAEAMAAGANGFITKPLFRSTVYDKLNELLNFDDKKPVQKEEEKPLTGLHLLIAEDNDVNWEIIHVMLEFQEITAERAENGQVCIDMLNQSENGKYDAILMDIQMPIMNGKEASKIIRSSENEYIRNIPIIAMTADAFAEDIKACKEAGMNGHVAKPLDMKKLIKELCDALNSDKK